jgi:hypothetical protein
MKLITRVIIRANEAPWLLPTVALIITIILSALVLSHTRAEAKREREVGYHAALQAYSNDLNPGLTRWEVENYLRARNTSFKDMCCVAEESYYADLVKIGEESAPWCCSEEYVYVALEFSAVEEHDSASFLAKGSEVLKRVEIFQPDSGCLGQTAEPHACSRKLGLWSESGEFGS